MKEKYFIGQKLYKDFLKKLVSTYRLLSPSVQNDKTNFKFIEDVEEETYIPYRSGQPILKSFLFGPRDLVATYFTTSKIPVLKKTILLGIKACDLNALKILDYNYISDDYTDEVYKAKRDSIIIFSSDCSDCNDYCFCTEIGFNPYPDSHFDLNFSKVDDGFIVEVGSEKGKEFIEKYKTLFQDISGELLDKLEKARKGMVKKVHDKNREYKINPKTDFRNKVNKNYNAKFWEEEVEKCVDCGACVMACPACRCYILYDVKQKNLVQRFRYWDACMFNGYARVAGGGTPRPKLSERYANRFLCKFSFFYDNANQYSCVGCGRCSEGCIGQIDIRSALNKLCKL